MRESIVTENNDTLLNLWNRIASLYLMHFNFRNNLHEPVEANVLHSYSTVNCQSTSTEKLKQEPLSLQIFVDNTLFSNYTTVMT